MVRHVGRGAADFYTSVFENSRVVTVTHYTHFWERLSEGGEKGRCGWLKYRFGLSWPVVPTGMEEVFADPDPERAGCAMGATLKMSKIEFPDRGDTAQSRIG